MRTIAFILLVCLFALPSPAQKKPVPLVTRDQAAKTVLAKYKDATVKSVELEKESGKRVWSFDLAVGKKIVEVWVDVRSGAIVHEEEESPAKESAEEAAEASLKACEKAALKKVPGVVSRRSMKTEHDSLRYVFFIKKADGSFFEVEVDAKSHAVMDVERAEAEGAEDDND